MGLKLGLLVDTWFEREMRKSRVGSYTLVVLRNEVSADSEQQPSGKGRDEMIFNHVLYVGTKGMPRYAMLK